jgi:hypothetical protein
MAGCAEAACTAAWPMLVAPAALADQAQRGRDRPAPVISAADLIPAQPRSSGNEERYAERHHDQTVENVWEYLRQNQLSLRVWPDYAAIVETCCRAWNALMAVPDRIASITRREWTKPVTN